MNTFHVTIITPEGKIYESEVNSLTVPGYDGLLGILANHAPIVVSLTKGVLKINDSHGEQFWALNSGVLEVNEKGDTLMLVDVIIKAPSVTEAKEKLKDLQEVSF